MLFRWFLFLLKEGISYSCFQRGKIKTNLIKLLIDKNKTKQKKRKKQTKKKEVVFASAAISVGRKVKNFFFSYIKNKIECSFSSRKKNEI